MRKKDIFLIALAIISTVLYLAIQYTPRQNFTNLIVEISILFAAFGGIFWQLLRGNNSERLPLFIVVSAIVFRMVFLFSTPNLSDDYFRFIWDGNLTASGVNPYLSKPHEISAEHTESEISGELLHKMNSPQYNSVYLPLNQYFFAAASFLSGGIIETSVIILRLFIILADCLTIFTLPLLLKKLGFKPIFSVLYLINPLVIIEGAGNLHFEVVACALLIPAFSMLLSGKLNYAALFLGLASGLKALPLMLLPAFSAFSGMKKFVLPAFLFSLTLIIPFIPMLEYGTLNMLSSFDLYFRNFEFNASLYYIVRHAGFLIWNYNIIGYAGPILASITCLVALNTAFIQKRNDGAAFFRSVFISVSCYYLLSTSIHPWYIINLIIPGIAGGFTWTAMTWSFTVFLSYHAYSAEEVREYTSLLFLQYVPVYTVLLLESFRIIPGIRLTVEKETLSDGINTWNLETGEIR